MCIWHYVVDSFLGGGSQHAWHVRAITFARDDHRLVMARKIPHEKSQYLIPRCVSETHISLTDWATQHKTKKGAR